MGSLITGDFSFGKNVAPDQVTTALRERMIATKWSESRSFLTFMVPFGGVITFYSFFAPGDPTTAPEWLPHPFGLPHLVVGIFAVIIGFSLNKTRAQVRLLRDGVVTKGIVEWAETKYSWTRRGALIAKVKFRYIPVELLDLPDSDLLRSDIPHFAKQVSFPVEWGSFGADLKSGSLVSVLYDPQKTLRSLIVDEFRTSSADTENRESG